MATRENEPSSNSEKVDDNKSKEGSSSVDDDKNKTNKSIANGKGKRKSKRPNENMQDDKVNSNDANKIDEAKIADENQEAVDFQAAQCDEETSYSDESREKTSLEVDDSQTGKDTGVVKGQIEEELDRKSIIADDDGDPIPSGTGTVSRECSASDLVGWSELLPRWHSKLNQRPKGLETLVKNGIPEPLRGEVWQLLSGAQQCSDLMEQYRILLTKSAPSEQIILRDVHRTYPAHENFRTNSGSSSLIESLFKVCKAYAVYDEEVGYCQGLSFLVAALLLHMPEEQAFCVFVRIMNHYKLRDLFRNNFDELYLKFYQLERLLEDNMPDLYQHFSLIGLEPFTYASQWFLTVFTAKFPLNAVFYILDIFLLDGMNTIFQIALALLQASKEELLASDFEGVLKYFRVQMPKRYRNQYNVQQLILASSAMSLKKLPKHAKSYELVKQKEKLLENPISRLQRENAKLTENNLRLEQENDDLARDLVASKIQLRSQLDAVEDKAETLNRALTYSRQDCQSYLNTISDMEDEHSRLEVEVSQLKEVCRRELSRAETELARNNSIINDYKKICSQMSKRLDYRLECAEQFIASVNDALRVNESCAEHKCSETLLEKADVFLSKIKSDDKTSFSDKDAGKSKQTIDSTTARHMSSTNRQFSSDDQQRKTSSELDYANRPVGALLKSTLLDSKSTSSEVKIKQLTEHIDELEIELARTKLALVEAECKCQQLTHDLNAGSSVKVSSSGKGLSSRLGFVRSAVGSASPTTSKLLIMANANQSSSANSGSGSGGGTFTKLNNLISERISNIGQNYQYYSSTPSNNNNYQASRNSSSLPVSSSTSSLASVASNDKTLSVGSSSSTYFDEQVEDAVRNSSITEQVDQNKC